MIGLNKFRVALIPHPLDGVLLACSWWLKGTQPCPPPPAARAAREEAIAGLLDSGSGVRRVHARDDEGDKILVGDVP
jgi:hypothetical protein